MASKRKTTQTPSRDEATGRVLGSKSRLETEAGLAARLVQHVSRGRSLRVAAMSEGVPHRTFFGWLDQGRADFETGVDSVFARFADSLNRALGEYLGLTEEGLAHPETDESGRADAVVATNRRFIVERRLPSEYGKRLEHTVRVDATEHVIADIDAGVDAGEISPEARAQVLRWLARETSEMQEQRVH